MAISWRTAVGAVLVLAAGTALWWSQGGFRALYAAGLNESRLSTAGSHALIGEVWVDNWFALHVNGAPLIEDSVPITTERSFNAERFTFRADPPFTFAIELRDFMENATGLEYIGSRRQQMGDGGAIVQFRDAESGELVAASGEDWRCLVIQHAPQDASCADQSDPQADQGACAQRVVAIPEDWTSPAFDDSAWQPATPHTAAAVRPKDGYDRVAWDAAAEIIWSPDLVHDNIVLCRLTVEP